MAMIQKRISRDGAVSWRALIRLKGYPTESATFTSKTKAEHWAQRIEADMRERRHFRTAESKKRTVAELIDRYLKKLETENPQRHRDVKPMLAWWRGELGHLLLVDLNEPTITEKLEKLASRKIILKDGREKKLSPARINRYFIALSTPCTLAHEEWKWLDHHPMQFISKRKEPDGRIRFLNEAERAALLKACQGSQNELLYMIVVLAISTGARRNELMKLSWKQVDFTRNGILMHTLKGGKIRIVPLTGFALELMKKHKQARDSGKVQCMYDDDLVFPSPGDSTKPYDFRSAWDSAVLASGIENFRFHDLRHTAASYLAMNGASLLDLKEILGHRTLAMVQRYAHLTESHTRGVVTSMNEKVFGSVVP